MSVLLNVAVTGHEFMLLESIV